MDDYCSQVCASSIYAPWHVIYLLFLNAVVHSICMFFPMKYSISFFFFFFNSTMLSFQQPRESCSSFGITYVKCGRMNI
jgi:hypothetical protein